MDRFATLQLFVRVADTGSFTRAARELGIGQPAVSKTIAALEARLGTRLFQRTSRQLRPTAAGVEFHDAVVCLLRQLEEVEARVGGGSRAVVGRVRVSIPPSFGARYIVPELPRFLEAYPRIEMELSVAERQVDLVAEGFDLALRAGHLADSALVSRRIGSMRACTVATPAYLERRGTPQTVDDLAGHELVAVRLGERPMPWRFGAGAAGRVVVPAGRVCVNDADSVRAAVLAGLGIAHDHTAVFGEDLAAGRVARILCGHEPEPLPIQIVHPYHRAVPRRVEAASDFLAAVVGAQPHLKI